MVDLGELRRRFDRLSQRERGLLLAVLVAVFYQAAQWLLADGQLTRMEQLQRGIDSSRQQLAMKTLEAEALTRRLGDDPNAGLRQRIATARRHIDERRQRLQTLADGMIDPREMARLLEDILLRQGDLQLRRLATLETRELEASPQQAQAQPRAGQQQPAEPIARATVPVYRHGFVIEFTGSYLATLGYLEALQALPANIYWDRIDFSVDKYPRSEVRIELHTLSLSEEWIGV